MMTSRVKFQKNGEKKNTMRKSYGDSIKQRRRMSRSKNLCLSCWWYNRSQGRCAKPLDEGYCKITRSV